MSTANPFAKYIDPAASADQDNPFAKYVQPVATPVQPKRSLWTAINDNVIEVANAAAGNASAVANFVRPGNAASQWIDKNFIEAGQNKQSDVVKAEKARYAQEMEQAQGFGDEVSATLGYVARNPLLRIRSAMSSLWKWLECIWNVWDTAINLTSFSNMRTLTERISISFRLV